MNLSGIFRAILFNVSPWAILAWIGPINTISVFPFQRSESLICFNHLGIPYILLGSSLSLCLS